MKEINKVYDYILIGNELEYVNERIVRSRNFNNKGQLNVEQTFYANGQVHYRNEYTPNGRITTEFDFNGKKK